MAPPSYGRCTASTDTRLAGAPDRLEREVTKRAIRQVIRSVLRGSFGLRSDYELALTENDCFILEFAGDSKYVTNYCDARVEIRGFIQHIPQQNRLVAVGCRPVCVFNPGEMHQLPPRAGVGPFVSVDIRAVRAVAAPQGEAGYNKDIACPSILGNGVWRCMPGTEGGRLPGAGSRCPMVPNGDGTWRCT